MRSAVHTAAAGVLLVVTPFVPTATQVVVVHESPVIEEDPVGKVDSSAQALAPLAAGATVRMVGSKALD